MIKIEIIDLTHKITQQTPKYNEDPKTKIKTEQKENYQITTLQIGTHTGTHIDAPKHYLKNGKTINTKPLNELIGKGNILKTNTKNKEIKLNDIENPPEKYEKITIIKTEWCKKWGKEEYFTKNPYPSEELIKHLLKNNVKIIGIDTPSIDPLNSDKNHKLLLKNNIYIVENLTNTEKLVKNKYEIYFIPLKLNTEASPIRAFAK